MGRTEDDSDAISEAELREFLEADLLGVKADPDFVARLRSRLWELLQAKTTGRGARRSSQGRSQRRPLPPSAKPPG